MVQRHATVLVVEDEKRLADAHGRLLATEHDVRTAYTGADALRTLDSSVDIVLLDRRLPDLPGETVLERIHDRGVRCRVAMVTGVEPDTDILDMEFDEYLTKPVTETDLRNVVDRLLVRATYTEGVRELYALAAKRAALEAADASFDDDRYHQLTRHLDRQQAVLEDLHSELDLSGAEFGPVFRDLERYGTP